MNLDPEAVGNSPVARLAFLAQLGTTLPLVGLIWLVQVVSYPLFLHVGRAEFAAYHATHVRLIGFVVVPLMFGEILAAFAWVVAPASTQPVWLRGTGLALAIAAWVFTFALAVPRHDALARGFDPEVIKSLVDVNWLRTVAWTARGALLLWVVTREG